MFSDFTQHTTWIYRQLYTGLSYDLLQKFYHGISAAAYFCMTACKTDLPTLFINHKKEKSTNEIQNDDEKIVAKTM